MRKFYEHYNNGYEIYDAYNGRILIVRSRSRDVYQCEVYELDDDEGMIYTDDQLFTHKELMLMEVYQ